MEMDHSQLEQASKILHERNYFKKALENLSENARETLGYTEQDEVPDDVIDNIETWALLVLNNAEWSQTEAV